MRRNRDFIHACAQPVKGSPIPHKFAMWSAISAVAGALGRKCWFSMPNYDVRPNLFIVLVGPPGTNKSVSLILPFSKVFSKLTTPVGTKEDDDEFNVMSGGGKKVYEYSYTSSSAHTSAVESDSNNVTTISNQNNRLLSEQIHFFLRI